MKAMTDAEFSETEISPTKNSPHKQQGEVTGNPATSLYSFFTIAWIIRKLFWGFEYKVTPSAFSHFESRVNTGFFSPLYSTRHPLAGYGAEPHEAGLGLQAAVRLILTPKVLKDRRTCRRLLKS